MKSKKIMIIILIIVILLIGIFVFISTSTPKRSGLENGTRITLTADGVVLHATLNNTEAAKNFEDTLPRTITTSKSNFDYCGTIEAIEKNNKENQTGWKIGDISLVGDWFSIFHNGQNNIPILKVMVIGSIDNNDITKFNDLTGTVSFNIEIEKDETNNQEVKDMNNISLTINNKKLEVALENNSSVDALIEKLKESDITIDMSDYANMEKVGSLGFTLPTNDKNITTESGDIILYMGNSLVIYYDINSWNFTKLGHINNISNEELKELLGDNDTKVTLSLN